MSAHGPWPELTVAHGLTQPSRFAEEYKLFCSKCEFLKNLQGVGYKQLTIIECSASGLFCFLTLCHLIFT